MPSPHDVLQRLINHGGGSWNDLRRASAGMHDTPMISFVLVAFALVVALIVLFSRFFKKVLDSRRQKVVVLITSIILFMGCILLSLDNVDEWTPLRDFSAVVGVTSMWMILYNVLVLATYATCGFSIGCGFLQVTQAAMDTL